ncbi:MAG: glycerate kinase [Isosphaeraceae bacterium]
MKVVIAPDKFRGSLSAIEAAQAISRGVFAALPTAKVDLVPMADGGEGTVEALVEATQGSFHSSVVTGPLGDRVSARWGILGDGETAVIEMASVSGLHLIASEKRNPYLATTFGTGELVRAAIATGVRRVIVGIGGSASNDGGAGLAQALGYRLLDREGQELDRGGASLANLDTIDWSGRESRIGGVEVIAACDVNNPLCGPQGASAVYGPQKGATPEMVDFLDKSLAHFARIVERDLGCPILDLPGAGAAGGLGGGLVAFALGRLEPGVTLVIRTVELAERLRGADLCLTGEGTIDASTAFGKTAVGVGRLARSLGCPTLAFAGAFGKGAETVLTEGIDAIFSLCPGPITLEEAVSQAKVLLERAAEQAVRCFLAGRKPSKSPRS